jgi:hypothetical protein
VEQRVQTLVLSPRITDESAGLGAASRRAGWDVVRLEGWRPPDHLRSRRATLYGDVLFVEVLAAALGLALIEAPSPWLPALPEVYVRRRVWESALGEARGHTASAFVKPADGKSFPAAVYESGNWLGGDDGLPLSTPVLTADPVEWEVEFRCFVLDRTVTTWSPYLRGRRLAAAPDGTWPAGEVEVREALAFAAAFLADPVVQVPPAMVLDVGRIRGRGWAVVEANGAWASGIYGASPDLILSVLAGATRRSEDISDVDRQWVRQPVVIY